MNRVEFICGLIVLGIGTLFGLGVIQECADNFHILKFILGLIIFITGLSGIKLTFDMYYKGVE